MRVYAVDVGHGQMRPKLRDSEKVVVLEATNARDLDANAVPESVQVITADLSFISLRVALGPALAIAAPGAWAVLLIKPQFEVGPAAVPPDGIIRDPAVREHAVAEVTDWIAAQRWRKIGAIESPITGRGGNIEYLLAVQKANG